MRKRSKSTPSGNIREQREEDEQTENNGGKWIIKNTFLEWKQEREGITKGKRETKTRRRDESERRRREQLCGLDQIPKGM